MPNMFGGAQDHPSYDPRRIISEDEDYVDLVLYQVKLLGGEWCVVAEDVSGNNTVVDPPTEKLQTRLKEKRAA